MLHDVCVLGLWSPHSLTGGMQDGYVSIFLHNDKTISDRSRSCSRKEMASYQTALIQNIHFFFAKEHGSE